LASGEDGWLRKRLVIGAQRRPMALPCATSTWPGGNPAEEIRRQEVRRRHTRPAHYAPRMAAAFATVAHRVRADARRRRREVGAGRRRPSAETARRAQRICSELRVTFDQDSTPVTALERELECFSAAGSRFMRAVTRRELVRTAAAMGATMVWASLSAAYAAAYRGGKSGALHMKRTCMTRAGVSRC
jgi:hypothetical protein